MFLYLRLFSINPISFCFEKLACLIKVNQHGFFAFIYLSDKRSKMCADAVTEEIQLSRSSGNRFDLSIKRLHANRFVVLVNSGAEAFRAAELRRFAARHLDANELQRVLILLIILLVRLRFQLLRLLLSREQLLRLVYIIVAAAFAAFGFTTTKPTFARRVYMAHALDSRNRAANLLLMLLLLLLLLLLMFTILKLLL